MSLLLAVMLASCGRDDGSSPSTSAARPAAGAKPALAVAAAKAGEIVFDGQASPAMHGPLELDGTYLVRFEQTAPEDPDLDFAGQTPFEASLRHRAGDPRGAIKLFSAARRSGRRELRLRGRYVLDVSFGDFPYAVRFTPR
jgi:hypothetical protein